MSLGSANTEGCELKFCRASSVDQALAYLGEWGADGYLLAGSTDLMPQYNSGDVKPGALIQIEGIESLSSITSNERTSIGALVSHSRLAANEEIVARHPALAKAASLVGGWQTQAVGTVGGNICNASPAADLAPPLLIADAQVTLVSASGERHLSLDEFFTGRRQTARRTDELLTSIELEPLPNGSAEVYIKLGRRGAMDVAIVGLAVRLALGDDGKIATARVAVCALAPKPMRLPEVEAALAGLPVQADELAAAGKVMVSAVSPIDDNRATASYRKRVLPGLLQQAVFQCAEEIQK